MNKPVFGLLLGGALGVLDGLTAWFTPEVRNTLMTIVIGSTIKGMVAGVAIGLFSRKVHNVAAAILFGTAIGGFLAFWVAFAQHKYYLEIMLPGSLVGLIVGLATQKYPRPAVS